MPLLQHRLQAQAIADARFATPEDVVRWQVAVQAQDYLGSLWAVGLRMREASEAAVEHAIAQRRIVRTWPMRGTLHLVAADDVRWMLELLAPRVIAANAARIERDFALDAKMLAQCRRVVERVLADGHATPRNDLYTALDAAGIPTAQQRGLHITGRLAMEGLICCGPRVGKQPTFAWLDQWLPRTRRLPREDALAELALRYFSGHGPATVQDFAWWSGLTVKDAQAGLGMVQSQLQQQTVDGRVYWHAAHAMTTAASRPIALLPPFDEYLVGYKDRSAAVDPARNRQVIGINGLVNPSIVIDGRIAGTWKRTLRKDAVVIGTTPFAPLKKTEAKALAAAAARYGEFLGVSAELA
ncbi:MAG TPA: winged helix DNA-binding domain-containing protein [Lysobacter sp.]